MECEFPDSWDSHSHDPVRWHIDTSCPTRRPILDIRCDDISSCEVPLYGRLVSEWYIPIWMQSEGYREFIITIIRDRVSELYGVIRECDSILDTSLPVVAEHIGDIGERERLD
jgi:hypothetical protein